MSYLMVCVIVENRQKKSYRKKDVWLKRSNKITVLDTNSWSLAFY